MVALVLETKPSKNRFPYQVMGDLDFTFLPAGGQFHLSCNDDALTTYGGCVATPGDVFISAFSLAEIASLQERD
jgi:hypothetical protein